ncbi:hypothetical protein [Aeromonas phage 4L372D]|uniref:Uncharacterized protein n=1 Tax=Aeromonas phage 4L372D TaxID=2588518 RepID=A0A5B9N4R4_9CAUD|nr:hypothetical protein HWC27_gp022 [Aeromonas phage 4L372D]YP_009846573.1 hypothetical protein HWC27_gp025 [Aeromonas phage 4L372D]YP_009846790.1 hypothetical protein HWC27_gp149 [Aeromonas phage 4L372D]QEG08486.1 hypothetical protein [Aeromonas phage 4L372D]QEG08489.1 hypothetical protein [Aeromonas phage 4L372D]QEG08706.1 hypothetical protein [Aeromonas phage 4L372D]
MDTKLYYKLVCIDEQHAIIAEQQLNNAETGKLKAKRLGRAVIVSINKDGLEQKELSEINYLLSSVRVHAMAYDDDELSQYDIDEIDKI